MGIYTAPGQIVFGNDALPQRIGNEPLMGLGYKYFGENRSGVPGVLNFNPESAKGKKGAGTWSVKRGSIFSGPGDVKLAEWVYRFQHDYQNCKGYDAGQNLRNASSTWDVRRNIDYCRNRDGMIGNATMCQIVKAIATDVPFWGQFWNKNIDPKANTSHYLRDGAAPCGFLCSDVACDKRSVTNCPPCGDAAASVTQTTAVGEAQQQSYQPPPTKTCPTGYVLRNNGCVRRAQPTPTPPPGPAPAPPNIQPSPLVEEESNLLLYGGLAGIALVGGYFLAKNRGWIK